MACGQNYISANTKYSTLKDFLQLVIYYIFTTSRSRVVLPETHTYNFGNYLMQVNHL